MANKYTAPNRSTLLDNKLGKPFSRLQSQVNPQGSNTTLITEEAILIEASKLLAEFYKKLGSPRFDPNIAIKDTIPDLDEYNDNFQMVSDDLEILFAEFENLEKVVLGNFNYMVSRLDRLQGRLKGISSQLADFILFSEIPTKDVIFFSDSFSNLTRTEQNSPLLNNTQCEINQDEGIISLPINRSRQNTIAITQLPAINTNSNGVVGNNQEIGATLHGDISVLLDNNPDTWFEYERVVYPDDGVPLVLDLTINLGESKVINHIRINPNNFGTRTQIDILKIDTSIDGQSFVSIKDDIPIAGFLTQDEENIFILAPSTSKFAGQGIYTFTPRKAKYIRLAFKQSTPYVISTINGEKHRYAIGIRDITIEALPYDIKGEFISKEYILDDEIKKVVLLSNQNPDPATTSKLVSISHAVSPDNGITWYFIRPKVSSGKADTTQDVPEILDFNGAEVHSITTTSPVKSLRYKAILERYTDAFTTDAGELAQDKKNITELHTPPSTTPFEISLQKTPVDGSIKLVDVNYGSRGYDDNKYVIGTGTGGKLKFKLPIALKYDYIKDIDGSQVITSLRQPETIIIDGDIWANGLNSGSGSTDKVYYYNFTTQELEFGDGTTGKAAPNGSTIYLYLNEERLHPSIDPEHIAKLDYPTVADKDQIEITCLGTVSTKTVVLQAGATRHQLDPRIFTEGVSLDTPPALSFSDGTIFANRQNDIKDVNSTGDYYIDWVNGVLTHYTPIPRTTKVTCSYSYFPSTILNKSDWDFSNIEGGVANAISISDNVYQTNKVYTYPETLYGDSKYISLKNFSIVPNTLEFTTSSGVIASGVYGEEVPFVDGRTELLGVIFTQQAIAAIEGIVGAQNITRSFDLPISSDTSLEVKFTNTVVFTTDVSPATPSAVGEYSVNRASRQFTVRVSSNVLEAGYVSYYYIDPHSNLTGRYSVNYKTGEIYLHDPTGSADQVKYEYTNYVIKYPIAREVPNTDWSYDKTTNKISIQDREILRNQRATRLSQGNLGGLPKYYQVSYSYVDKGRDDIVELEPYFSPILREYALKIITSSRMI